MIEIAHNLMENLKTSVTFEGLYPPDVTLKMSYFQNPSYYTEVFTKVIKTFILSFII